LDKSGTATIHPEDAEKEVKGEEKEPGMKKDEVIC